MQSTTVIPALVGGTLIGLAAALLLLGLGRICGVSGILGGLLRSDGETRWRASFIGGLLVGGLALQIALPQTMASGLDRPLPMVAISGLLVGVGTRLGNGCTSGHGVCGVALGSRRSLVATMTFMATGALAVLVSRQLMGGSL